MVMETSIGSSLKNEKHPSLPFGDISRLALTFPEGNTKKKKKEMNNRYMNSRWSLQSTSIVHQQVCSGGTKAGLANGRSLARFEIVKVFDDYPNVVQTFDSSREWIWTRLFPRILPDLCTPRDSGKV